MSRPSGSRQPNSNEDDDDLEMLRQAALKTLGSNKNKRRDNSYQSYSNASQRIRTNGNLIEIQPTELGSASGEVGSDGYIVEEFVLDGSDISINSSDCDEVIEEVIVSDAEEAALVDDQPVPVDRDDSHHSGGRRRSRSRSTSSHCSSDSDAVSIKSSYSLIMDEGDGDFLSVEAKFLSRKAQKQNPSTSSSNPTHTVPEDNNSSDSQRKGLGSSAHHRPGRRSRSPRDNRGIVSRRSKSRSRSPIRRRNHSPLAGPSRGMRRSYRTSSNERSQRRRRTRSKSPMSRSPSRRIGSQATRRIRSRSRSPLDPKPKRRSVSNGPKSPPEMKQDKPLKPDKVVNKNASTEEMDRLEKRRRKFQGESEVAPGKKVIKIVGSQKDGSTSGKKSSSAPDKHNTSSTKPTVLKEKVQTTITKRVPPVEEGSQKSNDSTVRSTDKSKTTTNRSEGTKSGTGEVDNDQEDLRTRLIKKKLEKLQQTGASGPPSSVVVSLGSQRIFSQALKNSKLLDSVSGSSETNKSSSSSKSSSSREAAKKPKSEVAVKSNHGSTKKLGSRTTSTSKSSTSSTKRVVSVTYS